MISLEEYRDRLQEPQCTQQKARELLARLGIDTTSGPFEGHLQDVPQGGEDVGTYISRVLAGIGNGTNIYHRDAAQNAGTEINIRNRVEQVLPAQQGIISAVTFKDGEQVIGHSLFVEGTKPGAVIIDARGREIPGQPSQPRSPHEAINRVLQIFPGQRVDKIDAVSVGLLPFDTSGGGQPLPIPHRPRMRQHVA